MPRVRQIVCPVIPGTPKSVVGPLDILPGCSVGTLDLATSKGIGGISHLQVFFEDRPEQTQCCNDVWPCQTVIHFRVTFTRTHNDLSGQDYY